MKHLAGKSLLSNIPLKLVSLIAGYCIWLIVGSLHEETITLKVPVCFYQAEERTITDAPESAIIKLRGKKNDLFDLDTTTLALHINAQNLHAGQNCLAPTDKSVFLPSTIKLVNCSPSPLTVTVA